MNALYHHVPLIRHASRLMVRELGLLRDPEPNISTTQCHILIELDQKGVRTVVELAESLRLDKSTASRAVARLVEQGWVAVGEHTADRRRKPLTLTSAGRKPLNKLNEAANRRVQQALETVSPEECQTILDGLQGYVKALTRARTREGLVFREVVREDNAVLAEVIRETMTEFGLNRSGSGYDDPEVDDIFGSYGGEGRIFYVVEQDGQVMGGGGIAPLKGGEADTCELQRMYLRPKLRGTGAGAELLKRCLDFARSAGYRNCYLETETGMERARQLYRRFGFEQRERRSGDTGHCCCNTWFIKSLS